MSSKVERVIQGVAGVGPLLFFAIATIEGFLRTGYNPVAQPISALSLGPRGWIQELDFVLLTASFLSLAVVLRMELRGGVASLAAPGLMIVMTIGSALSGIFPMDAPGVTPTFAGRLHLAGGFLIFPLMPLVLFVVARRLRRDARWRTYFGYTLATALFCLATIVFLLTFVGPPEFSRPYPGIMGLVQRLQLFPFFIWIALVVHRASAHSSAQLSVPVSAK